MISVSQTWWEAEGPLPRGEAVKVAVPVAAEIRPQRSPRIAELVAAQQIDIGLSVLPSGHPHVDAEIIMRFDMVCILPADHPMAKQPTILFDDLRQRAVHLVGAR